MSATEAEKQTVEIEEKVAAEPAPKPTREDLKKQGWTADEMDKAEKRGMVSKPDAPKKDEKKPEAPTAVKADEKPEEQKPPEEKSKAAAPASSIPDADLTPEQEEAFLKAFGPGAQARGLYFRMKNERRARQQAEARAKDLELELKTAKEKPAAPTVDEEGNVIDDEDKPLTLKVLKAMRDQEAKEFEERRLAQHERAQSVAHAQREQEEFAKSIYPDFDDAVKQAKEVMENLEDLVPEKHRQIRVVKLVRELQIAAANADKIALDEDHAAMIAYEIGKFHPKYGQKAAPEANGKPDGNPKDGTLSPEQMKRAENVTQRRGSSASVSAGGGKRIVSVDDIGMKELNAMTGAQRLTFREKHPERYAQIVRG